MYFTRIFYKEPFEEGSVEDQQKVHEYLTGLFGQSRKSAGLLYRLDPEDKAIYALSHEMPTKIKPDNKAYTIMTVTPDNIEAGKEYSFTLLALPSYRDKTTHKRRIIPGVINRVAWVSKKLTNRFIAAYDIKEVWRDNDTSKITIGHPSKKGGNCFLHFKLYTGKMRTSSPKELLKLISAGIGPEKAYGAGLVVLDDLVGKFPEQVFGDISYVEEEAV